ncbi:MAG: ATP-binding protein [Ilumatobacteraceae bacterium]
MGEPQIVDPTVHSTILRALGQVSTRSILAVRPEVVDGRIVDAVILWSTQHGAQLNPDTQAGRRISELVRDTEHRLQAIATAVKAFDQPGVPVRSGPHVALIAGEERQVLVSAVMHEDILLVEYDDVTDLVRTQRAQQESEHDFRQLMDTIDAGVVILRPVLLPDGTFDDAEILWSNETSKRMWLNHEGLQPGVHVADVYYDRADWLIAANAAWKGVATTRMLSVDPDIAPWTSATETLRRVGDTIVELTLDRTQDQLMLDKLAEADHRFAAVMEDLPVTVLVASVSDDLLEYVSPNAEALTGLPMHRLRRISQWISLVHPDDLPRVDAVADDLTERGRHEAVLRYQVPGGREFTAEVRMVRRQGPSGHDGFITIISDITEQVRVRERLESGTRLETLGRTAGSIAHDFNNLLMIVGGNIDRARHQLTNGSIVERGPIVLETAAVATQRAADLAHSLLAFARGRHGAPEVIRVDRLLRNFEPILRGIVHPRADLVRPYANEDWCVHADTAHLQQIVMNLVTNARDVSPPGSTVLLQVALSDGARCHLLDDPADTQHVAISVTDQGPGVPDDIATRIWEPFFSAKPLTNEAGSGLGLSTVHGLAHQHGGHVHLENHPGGGCTFTVYLPLVPPER